jgi:hypothetical protein
MNKIIINMEMHFVGSFYIMDIINALKLEHILICLFMMIFGSVSFFIVFRG